MCVCVCVQDYKPNARDWLSSYWKGFMSPDQMARIRNTGVPMDFLKEVGLHDYWSRLTPLPPPPLGYPLEGCPLL